MDVLGEDDEGTQLHVVPRVLEHRRRGLVARGLDPQHVRHGGGRDAAGRGGGAAGRADTGRRTIAFTCGGRTVTPKPVVSRSIRWGSVSETAIVSATVGMDWMRATSTRG